MKKYFTGEIVPPRNRVVTCQKCIRTPDLDRVGKTARHGTYFEMLGNFSFGDYFKDQAIPWAWEFLTETIGIPSELLWPSVYESDDEAFNIWKNVIKVPEERIVKLGKADNFWEHGVGPCGPCSEIYFDRGEKYGCGSADCKPGCDCDRYMEIWNNVFSQFNNMGDGTYTELSQKNIDTGMGLERLACVVQGVDNMFEVDTVKKIINKVCEISNKQYGKDLNNDVSIRVITDHIRGATFMICDGVLPSNEGRGYVLRRLLRRAARHGRLIDIKDDFLCLLCGTVINENKSAYPELVEKQDFINKIISTEESNFGKTIDQGLKMLNDIKPKKGIVSGDDAFKLYDTYGFPFDLTKDILEEKGLSVDQDRFNLLMEEQKLRARSARKIDDINAWKNGENLFSCIKPTIFVGYTQNSCEANIVTIIKDNKLVDSASAGDEVIVVLDKTPFYAESGGQVGDTGILLSDKAKLSVIDTTKDQRGIFTHVCRVEESTLKLGDKVTALIDKDRRIAIKRNHTAAHILQAALRSVLGTHVEQAGQLVNDKTVRFDFTHFSALSSEEINKIETWSNEVVLSGIDVVNEEMPLDRAKKLGAMALFGEKYGKIVRVVNIKDKSIELCGGTHIDNTAKIGLVKILSEASVASGVRRIEAVTGFNTFNLINDYLSQMSKAALALRLNNPLEIVNRCSQIAVELKEKDKKIEQLNSRLAEYQTNKLIDRAVEIGSVKLVTAKIKDVTVDTVRNMCDRLKDNDPSIVAVIAIVNSETASLAVCAGSSAVSAGVISGKAVAAIASVAGGKGGGKPDFAMAGIKQLDKIDKALSCANEIISDMIK